MKVCTLLTMVVATSAAFELYGCFPEDLVQLLFQDDYLYQSSGHCEDECSDSRYIGLISGLKCYCGDSGVSSDDEVSSLNCDTPCQGFPDENCGGSGYFLVYINSAVAESSSSSSESSSSSSESSSETSSSSSSASTTESSSESSSTSESDNSSSSTDSSSSHSKSQSETSTSSSSEKESSSTIFVSTTTGSSGAIETTVTETRSSSQTSSGSKDDDEKDSKSSSGLSGGAIAGIVIGSVAGVGLIAGLALFFCWYKRRHDDDDDDDDNTTNFNETKGFQTVVPPNVAPNPFVTKNSTIKSKHGKKSSLNNNSFNSTSEDYFMFDDGRIINGQQQQDFASPPYPTEDYGRRRLSDGSLPDMTTKGELKVVNN